MTAMFVSGVLKLLLGAALKAPGKDRNLNMMMLSYADMDICRKFDESGGTGISLKL
jgi:hypothetical protein